MAMPLDLNRGRVSVSLDQYRRFIDGLVELSRVSVGARRVQEGMWHPEETRYNALLAGLSSEQRETLAELFQRERYSAIHDVLVFLTDRKYHLSQEGIELAWEPYGTESYFD